jgi:uncharacterized protein YfaQ (DUF2300 family)
VSLPRRGSIRRAHTHAVAPAGLPVRALAGSARPAALASAWKVFVLEFLEDRRSRETMFVGRWQRKRSGRAPSTSRAAGRGPEQRPHIHPN